jgi:peptide/nickel transport system permease protein
MVLVYSPIVARLMRANVREEMAEDYVTVARAEGAKTRYLVGRHVAVNIASPTLVFLTLVAADAVVLEAGLSFLGAGVRPPTPSWGNLIQDGSEQMLAGNWWLTVFPGLAIFITVLALNTLAEAIADRIGGREHGLHGT